MSFDDFSDIMRDSRSGTRELIKSTKIPGSKGKDYYSIKISNKEFIANIPLNKKTATFMNSCKYGYIDVNYCIGWQNGDEYWDNHVLYNHNVPIYITNGYSKWVVMIEKSNKTYEVWDKFNNEDKSLKNKEPIPGFSIKKELLGSRKGKLYDYLRDDFFELPEYFYTNDEYEEAEKEYKELVEHILHDIGEYVDAYADDRYNIDTYRNDNINNVNDIIEDIKFNDESGDSKKLIYDYKKLQDDLEDSFDENEFMYNIKEFNKKHPNHKYEPVGQLQNPTKVNIYFTDINDYPFLLYVLEKQEYDVNDNKLKKINKSINDFIVESVDNYDMYQQYTSVDDIKDFIDNEGISNPADADEFNYNG